MAVRQLGMLRENSSAIGVDDMVKEMIFEKVTDVASTYSYLCVYLKGIINPFMEIGVNESRELEFTIYQNDRSIVLGPAQWEEIFLKARTFLPLALAEEDSFIDFLASGSGATDALL